MVNPLDLNNGYIIQWTIPREIKERSDIDSIKIYRSTSENYGYSLLETLSFPIENIPTSYKDLTGSVSNYYLITFNSTTSGFESNYHLTFKFPTPLELRYISYLKSMMPNILKDNLGGFDALTDNDYLAGLTLGLQYFNSYPPITGYTLDNFPKTYLYLLLGISMMLMIVARYLPISVRDWTYSEPGGVTLVVDRGSKFQQAIELIQKTYGQYLEIIKMDLSVDNVEAFGTIPLPLSLGGVIPQGVANILNIFNSIAR